MSHAKYGLNIKPEVFRTRVKELYSFMDLNMEDMNESIMGAFEVERAKSLESYLREFSNMFETHKREILAGRIMYGTQPHNEEKHEEMAIMLEESQTQGAESGGCKEEGTGEQKEFIHLQLIHAQILAEGNEHNINEKMTILNTLTPELV